MNFVFRQTCMKKPPKFLKVEERDKLKMALISSQDDLIARFEKYADKAPQLLKNPSYKVIHDFHEELHKKIRTPSLR